jgi:hypothetical protein
MTFIPIVTCIMTILYPVFISFITGIRDADILLEHYTETPELNVEAVTHAENRLRLTVTTPFPRFMLLYPLYPLYSLYVL